jgi:hypothetical protein
MIEFTSSGGIAGRDVTTKIDPAQLPADRASDLQKKLEAVKFFDIGEDELLASDPMPDGMHYEIKVDAEGAPSHTVKIDDSTLLAPNFPEDKRAKLFDLIDTLNAIASNLGG